MNTYKLSNIPLKTMLWFLEHNGLKHISTEGGHAKYTRADLLRPITIQTHICPVPEFIVSQILKHLGYNKKSFHLYCQNITKRMSKSKVSHVFILYSDYFLSKKRKKQN